MRIEDNQWYTVSVRRRHEKAVARNLAQQGYAVFFPTVKIMRRGSDRVKGIELPLFPGYVLGFFEPADSSRILMTPGVECVVPFAGPIGVVPDPQGDAVRVRLNGPGRNAPEPFPGIGRNVRVEYGVFTGLSEPRLDKVQETHTFAVLPNLLKVSVGVRLDPDRDSPFGPEAER